MRTSPLRPDPAKLRAARETAEITQDQMGELLGVGKSQISNIESGYCGIRAEHLAAWCEACGIENPMQLYSRMSSVRRVASAQA